MKSLRTLTAMTAGVMLTAGFVFANGAAAIASDARPVADNTVAESSAAVPDLTPEQIAQGLQELKASPVPRTTAITANGLATTYEFGNGLNMTIDESGVSPRLGGGFEPNGQFFVSFNQFDQDVLISGGGFALGTAICLIPGVGTLACVVVGAIITVGAVAVATNAKCKNNKALIVHVQPSWSTCR